MVGGETDRALIMSRIVLIHGFATGIRFSIFRKACGDDAGFTAFRPAVESGEAKAFRWDIKEMATFWQSLNPRYSWRIYHRERKIAESEETHQALQTFLETEKPEIVVCHSMGAYLLLKYLTRHPLPSSVRAVVFNQADIDPAAFILPPSLLPSLESGAIRFVNVYCPWDVTLLLSALVSGSRKAGLVPVPRPRLENAFFPLIKPWNSHTSAIRDNRFFRFVRSLV